MRFKLITKNIRGPCSVTHIQWSVYLKIEFYKNHRLLRMKQHVAIF